MEWLVFWSMFSICFLIANRMNKRYKRKELVVKATETHITNWPTYIEN